MKDSVIPTLTAKTEGNITITIPSTQALLEDQGYTYNQAGLTYNSAGVQYGGVYNYNWDFVPMLFTSSTTNPSVILFSDIYSPFVPPPLYTGIPIGPGFFLYITQ